MFGKSAEIAWLNHRLNRLERAVRLLCRALQIEEEEIDQLEEQLKSKRYPATKSIKVQPVP